MAQEHLAASQQLHSTAAADGRNRAAVRAPQRDDCAGARIRNGSMPGRHASRGDRAAAAKPFLSSKANPGNLCGLLHGRLSVMLCPSHASE